MTVGPIGKKEATRLIIAHHYLHRRPAITYAYGLERDQKTVGCVTFGVPASRHLQVSACRANPDLVIELNRLWVHDDMPRNTETWFLSRAMGFLPPMLIVSFADTGRGHLGIVYRAANFFYAGWTDMDRKTPKFDYATPMAADVTDLFGTTKGKRNHPRDASRTERDQLGERITRSMKVKYWAASGNARDRKLIKRQCNWPSLSWKDTPPPALIAEAPFGSDLFG